MSFKLLVGYDGSSYARDANADLRMATLPPDVEVTMLTPPPAERAECSVEVVRHPGNG